MLEKYEGKRARVTSSKGYIFIGLFDEYIDPYYKENGKESIVLNADDGTLVSAQRF